MKKYLTLAIVSVFLLSMIPSVILGQELPQLVTVERTSNCYNQRLIASGEGFNEEVAIPIPPISSSCKYVMKYRWTNCCCGGLEVCILGLDADFLFYDPNLSREYTIDNPNASGSGEFMWDPREYAPTSLRLNGHQCSEQCQIHWELYEECSKSCPVLYPKVDIEQFAVAGGSTIIKDGKILSSFEIAPGVQQTFIQVENRGFFTQNEAMVKFLGLPEGVTVNITPETQKIKAHNLGTYSATFTVGPNVPSGTYDVTMVAYSNTGTFDIIQFKFVVP